MFQPSVRVSDVLLEGNALRIVLTCVSGSSEPMLVAPSLTTSVSWVIVLAEDCAAWASFSWLDAAPATSSLVSSTSALAVFRMLSLRGGTHRGISGSQGPAERVSS